MPLTEMNTYQICYTAAYGVCTALASSTHSRPHSSLQRRRARAARDCQTSEFTWRIFLIYPVNIIRHKFPTVDCILQTGYINIFGTCETKLDNSFLKRNFMLKIVYIIAKTARGGGGGGDVML